MKKLSLLLVVATMLSAATSYATTFNYEYVFGTTVYGSTPPVSVSGTFDGTQTGDLITDIQNLTLFINQDQMAPPSDVQSNPNGGPTVISSILNQNNFNVSAPDFSWQFQLTSDFQYLQWGGWMYIAEGGPGDSWTVTPASVPDGGLTAMLLGMGMMSLGWVRRQVKR